MRANQDLLSFPEACSLERHGRGYSFARLPPGPPFLVGFIALGTPSHNRLLPSVLTHFGAHTAFRRGALQTGFREWILSSSVPREGFSDKDSPIVELDE